MEKWILIDANYKERLPKQDCKIWICRTSCFGDKWVQEVDYFEEDYDINWDGTYAFMIKENDIEPKVCEKYIGTIQNFRW